MIKYYIKFHTKKYDSWANSYDYTYYENIVPLFQVNDVSDILKAIWDKTSIHPDGIDFMVAVP